MTRVLARLESLVEDSPFVDSDNLDRLTEANVTLAAATWMASVIERRQQAGDEFPMTDRGQLLVELDDGRLTTSSFSYYLSDKKGE